MLRKATSARTRNNIEAEVADKVFFYRTYPPQGKQKLLQATRGPGYAKKTLAVNKGVELPGVLSLRASRPSRPCEAGRMGRGVVTWGIYCFGTFLSRTKQLINQTHQ